MIENFAFTLAKITVVNRDSPHTVTATGERRSVPAASQARRRHVHRTRSGSYSYICTDHPNTKGMLTVG
ncbi:hypothetical protein SNL152K_196 [Streptomyces sp. NL15-2K]|nr:hypothetical protein SNL152K_196 [Streptomyces sp. NL15-2K]